MRVEIARLHKELGATMIYVTHDQVEAMTLAEKIVVLREGSIEQIGKPLELYDDPANQFVAGFVGSPRMNFLKGRVAAASGQEITINLVNQRDTKLTKRLTGVPPGLGSPITLGIRPEHFREAGKGDCDLEIDIDVAEHLGSTSFAYANTAGGEQLVVERSSTPPEGDPDRIVVSIPAEKTFVFSADGARIR
ncbi:MAG: TOBE domain-containing protein, partial [Cucumibacter sp.]